MGKNSDSENPIEKMKKLSYAEIRRQYAASASIKRYVMFKETIENYSDIFDDNSFSDETKEVLKKLTIEELDNLSK